MIRSRLHEVARIRITRAESSTASDHRKVSAPRGTVKKPWAWSRAA
jgi:hypothetical protein